MSLFGRCRVIRELVFARVGTRRTRESGRVLDSHVLRWSLVRRSGGHDELGLTFRTASRRASEFILDFENRSAFRTRKSNRHAAAFAIPHETGRQM